MSQTLLTWSGQDNWQRQDLIIRVSDGDVSPPSVPLSRYEDANTTTVIKDADLFFFLRECRPTFSMMVRSLTRAHPVSDEVNPIQFHFGAWAMDPAGRLSLRSRDKPKRGGAFVFNGAEMTCLLKVFHTSLQDFTLQKEKWDDLDQNQILKPPKFALISRFNRRIAAAAQYAVILGQSQRKQRLPVF